MPRRVAATAGCTTTYTWRGAIFHYDGYGERDYAVAGRGVATTADALGTASPGANAATYTTTYGYTLQGDQKTISSPPVVTTQHGGTVTGPVVTAITRFDADGDPLQVKSANGYTTLLRYDHLGRQVAAISPPVALYNTAAGRSVLITASIGYDGDGRVVLRKDGAGGKWLASYDPLGRQVSATEPASPKPVQRLWSYSSTRLAASADGERNTTAYAYDPAGRLTLVADPLNQVTSYDLDPAGDLLEARTCPAGVGQGCDTPHSVRTEHRHYNAWNLPDVEIALGTGLPPAGLATGLAYTAQGDLAESQAPNGDVTLHEYTLAREDSATLVQPTGGASQLESYLHDGSGNLTGGTDFAGDVSLLGSDAADRATARTDYPGPVAAGANIATAMGYDPDGTLLSLGVSGPDPTAGTLSFGATVNGLDWTTGTSTDGFSSTYGYDGAGRVRTATRPLAGAATLTVATAVDGAGRATGIMDTLPGAVPASFAYDGNDQLVGLTVANGLRESRHYDAAGRLTDQDMTTRPPHFQDVFGWHYDYDAAGRTITVAQAGGGYTTQYLPDAAGRLRDTSRGIGGNGWTYDLSGNITARSKVTFGTTTDYHYDPAQLNELARVDRADWQGGGSTYYGYDNGGHVTSIADYAATATCTPVPLDVSRTCQYYDAQGRLSLVTIPHLELGAGGAYLIRMSYDALGRRSVYTVIQQAGTSPPVQTALVSEIFRYQGDRLAQVQAYPGPGVPGYCRGGDASCTESFVYRPDGTPLELLYTDAGNVTTRYWYLVDGRGTVTGLTDATTTGLPDLYGYDEWGLPDTYQTEDVPQPLRYRGYAWDRELGTYWLSVRQYDPALERFLQPDPSEREGARSYVYAGDDPADRSDPSGLGDCAGEEGCPSGLNGNMVQAEAAGTTGSTLEPLAAGTQLSLFDMVDGEAIDPANTAPSESSLPTAGAGSRGFASAASSDTDPFRPGTSVWRLPASIRGRQVEKYILGEPANISSDTFPVIDHFDRETGNAVSIKTFDVTRETYAKNPGKISEFMRRYAIALNEFTGATHDGITIEEGDIQSRSLVVAFEDGALNQRQIGVLERFLPRAFSTWPNITVSYKFIR